VEEGTYTEAYVVGRARGAYESGAVDFEILPERSALLVIDMQDEFVRPGWTPFWSHDGGSPRPRARAQESLGLEGGPGRPG
jgi:hypothetical protein